MFFNVFTWRRVLRTPLPLPEGVPKVFNVVWDGFHAVSLTRREPLETWFTSQTSWKWWKIDVLKTDQEQLWWCLGVIRDAWEWFLMHLDDFWWFLKNHDFHDFCRLPFRYDVHALDFQLSNFKNYLALPGGECFAPPPSTRGIPASTLSAGESQALQI